MYPFIHGTRHLSIHRQIMVITLAPALVVTGLLVFVVYQGNLQHNRQLLDQHGQLLVTQLAAALEYGLATGALEQLPAIVEATIQPATTILGTSVRAVTITDQAGHQLYPHLVAHAALPESEHRPHPVFIPAPKDVQFLAPILLQPLALSTITPTPRPLGEVVVVLSIADAQALWRRHLLLDLSLVLLTFVSATGLAHWTGRRLSGAIRQIAAAIQCIKNGNLATRVDPTEHNELGTLQEGVNLLAHTLTSRKAHLDV